MRGPRLGVPRSVSSNPSSLSRSRKNFLLERVIAKFPTEPEGHYVYMNGSPSCTPSSRSPEPYLPKSCESRSLAKLKRGRDFTIGTGVHSHRYILKAFKKAYEIEKEATPKPLQFQEFRQRYERNCRNRQEIVAEEPASPPAERPFSPYIPYREIELQCTENAHKSWLRRHRNYHEDQATKVQEWVKSLHSLLAPADTGLVSGKVLVGQLLALGLAHDPEDIIRIVLAIYGKSGIEELSLTLEDMMVLAKVDRESHKFLNFLSQRIESTRSKTSSSLSPARHSPIESWKDQFHTLPEFISQVSSIWQAIAGVNVKMAEAKRVADALCECNLYLTRADARKALGKEKDQITMEEFQSLFSKSIFVGSLISLAMKLISKNVTVSSKMLISKYQRRLMLAGLQGSTNGLDHESGLATLKAMEKYEMITPTPLPNSSKLYTFGLSLK